MIRSGSPAQKRWLDIWANTPLSVLSIKLNEGIDEASLAQNIATIFNTNDILQTNLIDRFSKTFSTKNMEAGNPNYDWAGKIHSTSVDQVLKKWQDDNFDLKNGPLVKMALLEDNSSTFFLIASPSIVLDEHSILIFANAILESSQVNEDTISYENFSDWWKESIADRKPDRVTHWDDFMDKKTALNDTNWVDIPEKLPAIYTFNQQEINDCLSKLKTNCQAPIADILLASWVALISRWNTEEDFIIGEIMHGRTMPELTNLMGPVARILPHRITMELINNFGDLLKQLDELRSKAVDYEDYFSLGNNSEREFFPFQFQFRTAVPTLGGIIDRWDSDFEPCTIKLIATLIDNQITLALKYDSDSLGLEAAEKISRAFIEILNHISGPETDLNCLQKLNSFNLDASFSYVNQSFAQSTNLANLWNDKLQTYDQRTAIIEMGRRITFSDLDRQSNALAKKLAAAGLIKGDITILKIPKSIEAIVGIIAVQKIGAAYLPLLPNTPINRAEKFELESQAKLVITLQEGEFLVESGSNPKTVEANSNCAYIIYTSGSTGIPKGVKVPEIAVLDLVDSLNKTIYKVQEKPTSIALIASLSFDASVQQIYASLLNGHTLVLISDEEKTTPETIIESFLVNKVSVFDCTPSLLTVLVKSPEFDQLSIQHILIGGEQLSSALVKSIFALKNSSNTLLWNLYGLTECGVDSTFLKIDKDFANTWKKKHLPIGFPFANSIIHLLDKFGNPVPPGIPGEIYIGGTGLAIGYVDSSQDMNHFIQINTNKIFRTGDFGYRDEQGRIHFIGRNDALTKIRGYRVDLLEIETSVLKIDGVSAAAIFVDETDKHLIVCALCLNAEQTLVEVQKAIALDLPSYMVPGRWLVLDTIPLTTSGKIDRSKLKQRSGESSQEEGANETEAKLIHLFTELMKRSIDRTTNIFDEGAHSLIILQAITRISKTFNQRLSFNTIYAHKTIEELALLIETNTDSEKRIIPINTHKSGNENLFLLPSSVGSSSVFSNFKLAESQNLWGLDYHSISKEDTQTIAALAMILHQEITRVDDSLTITLLGYSMGAYVALEIARILEKEGKSPQLILVDVNLNLSGKRISNLKEDERLNEIKQEFGSLLTNYSPVPLSSTPIVALEAKENSLPANMKQWRTYGSSLVHDYLEGDHDSVFSKANISTAILKVENALNTFTARRV